MRRFISYIAKKNPKKLFHFYVWETFWISELESTDQINILTLLFESMLSPIFCNTRMLAEVFLLLKIIFAHYSANLEFLTSYERSVFRIDPTREKSSSLKYRTWVKWLFLSLQAKCLATFVHVLLCLKISIQTCFHFK